MNDTRQTYTGAVEIERWSTELPLYALCIAVSLAIYLLLLVSIIGFVYMLVFALIFFVAHAALMAQVRGSAIRLGPEQLPALYNRVQSIDARLGLEDGPDAYLMQAGGALNAFATRFLGLNIIVLYSDLLDACGDSEAARDMIIAHELGHLKAGHVRYRWLIAPATLVPFLGSALSRAREYTCDRYGLAGAGDKNGALLGLTVLAAGRTHARGVNQQAMARQSEDLNTGWLTIGEWMGTHPPLSRRIAALEPGLVSGQPTSHAGRIRALALIGLVVVVAVLGSVLVVSRFQSAVREAGRQSALQQQLPTGPAQPSALEPNAGTDQAPVDRQ